MPSTVENTVELPSVERTLADLKENVQAAVDTQTQAAEQAARFGSEVSARGQATMEAFTQAAQIYARGSQDLLRQATENGWSAFQDGVSNLRAIATAPTTKQRIELQANLVRSGTLRVVADYNRFASAVVELAEQVSAPLLARAVQAAEKFTPAA